MRLPKNLRKYVLLFSLLPWLYYPVYIHQIFLRANKASSKIGTIKEAHRVLEQEKVNLGIEDRITLLISEDDKLRKIGVLGFCERNEDSYVIGINKSDLSRRLLRYELYHLFRDGCDNYVGKTIDDYIRIWSISEKKGSMNRSFGISLESLKLWYLKETRAHIYALTGLKL